MVSVPILMSSLSLQVGPRDPDRHSKLPYFLRLHGSVLPKMILPLVFMTVWSTLVTCISELIVDSRSNLLLYTKFRTISLIW